MLTYGSCGADEADDEEDDVDEVADGVKLNPNDGGAATAAVGAVDDAAVDDGEVPNEKPPNVDGAAAARGGIKPPNVDGAAAARGGIELLDAGAAATPNLNPLVAGDGDDGVTAVGDVTDDGDGDVDDDDDDD